jgi:hypothetical protein
MGNNRRYNSVRVNNSGLAIGHIPSWLLIAHLITATIFGANGIGIYPFSFAAYVVICGLAQFGANRVRFRPMLFSEQNNTKVTSAAITVAISIYCIININSIELPDFFLASYHEKVAVQSFLGVFAHGVLVASSMLAGNSRNFWIKVIATAGFSLAYLTSGSTSRGGLLLFLLPVLICWRSVLPIRFTLLTAAIILPIFFVQILMSRAGEGEFDLQTLMALETKIGDFEVYAAEGVQPEKWKVLFFYLPSFVKGEWIGSNQFISEWILGMPEYYSSFYIITVGDFLATVLAYGRYWFLYAGFTIFSAFLLVRIASTILPQYKIVFFVQFILIASRSSTESFLPVMFFAVILPIGLVIVLSSILSNFIKLNVIRHTNV